jgi:hypothetical protein
LTIEYLTNGQYCLTEYDPKSGRKSRRIVNSYKVESIASVGQSVSGSVSKRGGKSKSEAKKAKNAVSLGVVESNTDYKRVTIEKYIGTLESVEGASAYVTLVDSQGDEAYAEFDARELKSYGISNVDVKFTLEIVEEPTGGVIPILTPIPMKIFSAEESRKSFEELRELYGDIGIDDAR